VNKTEGTSVKINIQTWSRYFQNVHFIILQSSLDLMLI